MEPGETPSNSASHQAQTMFNVLTYRKKCEITTQFQFTETAPEPEMHLFDHA